MTPYDFSTFSITVPTSGVLVDASSQSHCARSLWQEGSFTRHLRPHKKIKPRPFWFPLHNFKTRITNTACGFRLYPKNTEILVKNVKTSFIKVSVGGEQQHEKPRYLLQKRISTPFPHLNDASPEQGLVQTHGRPHRFSIGELDVGKPEAEQENEGV